MRVGLVVHVRQRVRGVAVAGVEFECGVGQVGGVVPEALLGSAVGAQPRYQGASPCTPVKRSTYCHASGSASPAPANAIDGASTSNATASSGTRSRWSMSASVPDGVSLLAPGRDGLDVATVFIAAVCERCTRPGEVAGDGVRAACAVGSFGGDHREPDVCARMARILGDGGGEGDRRAVLDGEQPTHTLGVAGRGTTQCRRGRDEAGRPCWAVAGVVGEQLRDSHRLGADFGNRGGLPHLALADRAQTHDVWHRRPGAVDEVAVRVESDADPARVWRRDIGGQQVRPERAAVQGPPIPRGARRDDHRVGTPAHRSIAGCHNQLDASAVQRYVGDLARLDDQLATVDRGMDRIGNRWRHPVAKNLPLP